MQIFVTLQKIQMHSGKSKQACFRSLSESLHPLIGQIRLVEKIHIIKFKRMKLIKKTCVAAMLTLMTGSAMAGGLLTNTNQNVIFLRNPARDAAIGIDGVYSNPAGVAFLNEGFHLSINWQSAKQTREIDTTFPLFVNNFNNPGNATHSFKGEASAPVVPSLQAAYNTGKWSFQFGFAITGGGGKCEYNDGLGSFEQVVAGLTTYNSQLNQLYAGLGQAGIPGMAGHSMGDKYSFNSYMRGRQYYFGFTLGAAYKINDNLSVYGGARVLYGTANYYGYVKDINVECINNGESTMQNASKHFGETAAQLNQMAGAMEQMVNQPMADALKGYATTVATLSVATQDIELNCDQSGVGIAPIIGVDYKVGKFNFAAKYEFETKMRLKNKSANSASADNIDMLKKYADGQKVAEDSPALLTIGAQYEILPTLRVNAGWHHYFDTDTKQYTSNDLSNTNEYIFGAEYDITDKFQVSAGVQRTVYGLKDAAMNDISFNVSSTALGFGFGVKVAENIKINAAYFHSFYDDREVKGANATNLYTRTNRVFGVGADFTF